jgi:Zn finger protein HypA/HybF involved in hydrogenase expression
MALIKCRDCGHGVAETAKVCPSCGAKDPAIVKAPFGVRVAVGLAILLFLVWLASQHR